MNSTTPSTTSLADRLHDAAGHFMDGLITRNEPLDRVEIADGAKPEPQTVTADPALGAAFTPNGIASLLARIHAMAWRGGYAPPTRWQVSEAGDRLSGQAILDGDDVPSDLPPPGDHEWIMPTISFPLPPGSIHGSYVPLGLCRLRIHEGVLTFER